MSSVYNNIQTLLIFSVGFILYHVVGTYNMTKNIQLVLLQERTGYKQSNTFDYGAQLSNIQAQIDILRNNAPKIGLQGDPGVKGNPGEKGDPGEKGEQVAQGKNKIDLEFKLAVEEAEAAHSGMLNTELKKQNT